MSWDIIKAHLLRIHSHFQNSSDTCRMLEGIKTITNYRTTTCDELLDSTIFLADWSEKLADVLLDIFYISLSNAVVPTCPCPCTQEVSCMLPF